MITSSTLVHIVLVLVLVEILELVLELELLDKSLILFACSKASLSVFSSVEFQLESTTLKSHDCKSSVFVEELVVLL